jgi:hypothetical protein
MRGLFIIVIKPKNTLIFFVKINFFINKLNTKLLTGITVFFKTKYCMIVT